MAGQTFTTYINAKRTSSTDSEFAALEARAAKSLSGIEKRAEAANRALAGLGGGRGSGGLSKSPVTQAYLNGFDQAKIKADRLTEAQARLERENSTLVRSLRTSAQTLQIVQGPLGPIAGRVSAAADAFTRLSGVTLGFAGAAAGLFAYVRAANSFVEIRSRLAPLYDSQTQVNKALGEVAGIANRARAGLAPIVDLYARLKLAGDQYNISQARTAQLTELAAKAARLSGGTSQSQESGLYQFAQGIGSNQLGGDELRSVKENTLALSKYLQQGLANLPEFKGQIINLKALGEQGKLTADVVSRALGTMSEKINADFAKLPPTLSSAFTQLETNATLFVGRFEQATGIVGNLAKGVLLLANNLAPLVGILGGVAAGFAAVSAARALEGRVGGDTGFLARFKAEGDAAQQNLFLARQQQGAIAQRNVALAQEQSAIRANIAALETELAVQQQIAAQGQISARAGLPGGAQQAASGKSGTARVTGELADETKRLFDVQNQAATGARQYAAQQEAVGVATGVAAKSTSLLRAGAGALVGAINPIGIAVTIATSAFLAWALSESEAEKNAKKVADAQAKLASIVDQTTGKILEQNAALLAGIKVQQGANAAAAFTDYQSKRRAVAAAGNSITQGKYAGPGTPDANTLAFYKGQVASPAERQALGLLNDYGSGKIRDIGDLNKGLAALAAKDKSLQTLADRVEDLGSQALDAARQVEQFKAVAAQAGGKTDPETLRRSRGDFSGGFNPKKNGRNLDAEAIAESKRLGDQRYAAQVQQKESLEALEKKQANQNTRLSDDDYVRERAQIINTYNTALANIDKKDARSEAAHQRELERIQKEKEAEDARRATRTEKRSDILGQFSDDPKRITQAADKIEDLQKLVGETMNGIAEISKSNPLGEGIYTPAMAAADKARIEDGLLKPFREYLEAEQENQQIASLRLQGADLEAEALSKTLEQYHAIGGVTKDMYDVILHNLEAEQKTNDALAQREKIIAPLRSAVQGLESDISSAIESILNGGNPVTAGKNLFKGLLQQYNKIRADQLTAQLTAGLDPKIRDLISGKGRVDTAIGEYIGGLKQSETASALLADALRETSKAAKEASAALANVQAPATGASTSLKAVASASPKSADNSKLPSSFYKSGVTIGNGIGDNVIFQALGQLGAVITENKRTQSFQNSLFSRGLTTAKVSDHTRSDNAYDVRLPQGMTFAQATALITKAAQQMGAVVKVAFDETSKGGTGAHGHYVIEAAKAGADAAAKTQTGTPNKPTTVAVATVAPAAAKSIASAQDSGAQGGVSTGPNGEIVVTGTKAGTGRVSTPDANDFLKTSVSVIGANLDQTLGVPVSKEIGKVFTNIFGSSQGAQTAGGVAAVSLANLLSGAQGGGVNGAIKSVLSGVATAFPPLQAAMAISSGLSQIFGVKEFAGGLFGFGGNLIAKLFGFGKTKKASSTLSGASGVVNVGDAVGNSGKYEKAADALGGSVGDSLQQIADQLGATIGNFSVSIGQRKKKFVVDPSGQGKTKGSGVLKFDTEEEAIQAALKDAITDGAIAGLSAASQTILRKAKNLETALNKVQIIESIPRRLLALKDPVRAAVEDLNREFTTMIGYLKEGGATAAQYKEASELYDLERAKAIKDATTQASSAIQDLLDSMLATTQSPLNKKTVYDNAKGVLNRYAGDVQSGKAVDDDAFTKAVSAFQEASQALNGSDSSFFADFNYLIGLLNKEKSNIGASTAASAGSTSTLPASPFSDSTIQALINGSGGTTAAVVNQTNVLSTQLQQLIALYGGTYNGSAIALLPSNSGGGLVFSSGGGGGQSKGSNLLLRA